MAISSSSMLDRSTSFYLILIAILATLVKYELGESDQLTHIPLILKELDPEYLNNDNFVQANEIFGPRFYYSKFMALGSQLFTLQGWFLLLSLVCCFLTAYFSALTSKFIFKSEQSAILGAILVISLPTPTLAESTFTTYEHIMTPTALVFPFLVIAKVFLFFALVSNLFSKLSLFADFLCIGMSLSK